MTSRTDIWRSVVRGVAYGDSWGFGNEFKSYKDLTRQHACGPQAPEQMIISDDTQMTLSLARGIDGGLVGARLCALDPEVQYGVIRQVILDEWTTWHRDPDNNRAPGVTTMASCAKIAKEYDWQDATSPTSDTCGAVMRFAPVAFAPDDIWAPLSAWQAASTHGGASAIASSVVASTLLRRIVAGERLDDGLLIAAIEATHTIEAKPYAAWIAEHPLVEGSREGAEALIELGLVLLREQLVAAENLHADFIDNPWVGDPSEELPGWRAHHALACALLCVDMLPDSPVMALRRAATTDGDSDSIAAIAGAFIGALNPGCWPPEWFDRIEPRYQKWITETEHYAYLKEG